ncbi:unnamed protein product [Prorocentrum cordatum]|uniref:Uncharacterized protein n=1 Tax=Prorocentrum cordatum TaxID=2364126 RepID=A0ABN9W540_9DINO|nr:unnamed protein product [Polarella glacialis]
MPCLGRPPVMAARGEARGALAVADGAALVAAAVRAAVDAGAPRRIAGAVTRSAISAVAFAGASRVAEPTAAGGAAAGGDKNVERRRRRRAALKARRQEGGRGAAAAEPPAGRGAGHVGGGGRAGEVPAAVRAAAAPSELADALMIDDTASLGDGWADAPMPRARRRRRRRASRGADSAEAEPGVATAGAAPAAGGAGAARDAGLRALERGEAAAAAEAEAEKLLRRLGAALEALGRPFARDVLPSDPAELRSALALVEPCAAPLSGGGFGPIAGLRSGAERQRAAPPQGGGGHACGDGPRPSRLLVGFAFEAVRGLGLALCQELDERAARS